MVIKSLIFQFIRSELGTPNFQGLPFGNFEDEAKKFGNWTRRLFDTYEKNVRRQIKKRPNTTSAGSLVQKLRSEKLLCPHHFPGLMSQIGTHRPRLPHKPP